MVTFDGGMAEGERWWVVVPRVGGHLPVAANDGRSTASIIVKK
jgi:hypothetical protein